MVVLALALSTALLLVVDFLFGRTRAYFSSGALLALLLWWWLGAPLLQRVRDERDAPSQV
jgi:hypothetical protein